MLRMIPFRCSRPLDKNDFEPVLVNVCRCLPCFALDLIYPKKIGQHICHITSMPYIYIYCIYLVIHSLHGISFHVGKNDFIKPLHEGVSDANQC